MSAIGILKRLFGGGGATPASDDAAVERRRAPRINAEAGTRVLIIDDSTTIVAVLSKLLSQNGYTVLKAYDAESGLEIARQERPELVFLDIVLPGMSGFAALRLLRRDPDFQRVPIIMISGNAQATEQFYAQRIGADDFLKKPFTRGEVFGRIQRLIEAGRLRAQPLDEDAPPAPAEAVPAAAVAAPAMALAADAAVDAAPTADAVAAPAAPSQELMIHDAMPAEDQARLLADLVDQAPFSLDALNPPASPDAPVTADLHTPDAIAADAPSPATRTEDATPAEAVATDERGASDAAHDHPGDTAAVKTADATACDEAVAAISTAETPLHDTGPAEATEATEAGVQPWAESGPLIHVLAPATPPDADPNHAR